MKKKLVTILILALIGTAMYASENVDTDLYYINVPVLKVLQHKDGYVVIYRKGDMQVGQAYLPKKWFSVSEKKAFMGKLEKELSPYLTVYYRGGTIDHLRLSMPVRLGDPAWGILPIDADVKDKFNTDTFNFTIEY